MVYKIDDEKLKFYDDIFIKIKMGERTISSKLQWKTNQNALEIFKQIQH